MSIHPEDANSYAVQLHVDLEALTAAVERIAELLALSLDGERGFRVNGLIVTREDRP
jgi:hypothetical protein